MSGHGPNSVDEDPKRRDNDPMIMEEDDGMITDGDEDPNQDITIGRRPDGSEVDHTDDHVPQVAVIQDLTVGRQEPDAQPDTQPTRRRVRRPYKDWAPDAIVKVEPYLDQDETDLQHAPTGRGLRKHHYSWKLKGIYTPTGRRRITVDAYDPACPIPPQLDGQFQTWMDDLDIDGRTRSTAAGLQGKEWYRDLLDPTVQLKDEVVDALVLFTAKKLEKCIYLCRKKFAIGDVLLSTLLNRTDGPYAAMKPGVLSTRIEYPCSQENTIFRYVFGRQSDQNVAWTDADIVYTPINIGGNH
ncbi:uncharacterized protein LOC111022607 [Momordica charantia]|uniref:Uncharacterized protein LOC111022607 n=1 Tax=Momordica charantia TaxID=3673 RepID=A0A6J1DRS0_MOMCH|nr:uncharacterized protein LOC111022607 [Momordica charantia]